MLGRPRARGRHLPGYQTPQDGTSLAYYFTERGAFRLPTTYRTDLAVNYDFRIPALRTTTLFAQGHILNLFNGTKLDSPQFMNFTTLTRVNTTALEAFNPFTETPVEGVHWRSDPTLERRPTIAPTNCRGPIGSRSACASEAGSSLAPDDVHLRRTPTLA